MEHNSRAPLRSISLRNHLCCGPRDPPEVVGPSNLRIAGRGEVCAVGLGTNGCRVGKITPRREAEGIPTCPRIAIGDLTTFLA